MNVLQAVLLGVYYFLSLLQYILIADAILSWFVSPFNRFRAFLMRITGPLAQPFRPLTRRLTARSGIPIDFAPLLAFFALALMQQVLMWIIGIVGTIR